MLGRTIYLFLRNERFHSKGKETVYVDVMEVKGKENVVTLVPGNYLVRARVKKWDRVYEEKEIRTEMEKDVTPMNLNPFVMFPIALVDLALFGEVVRRRVYGGEYARVE